MKKRILVFMVCWCVFAASRFACRAQSSPGATGASGSENLPGLNTAYIDKTADPCTDFFQYACGNFSKLHPIPPDRSWFGNMTMLADDNQGILHSILEKAAAGGASRTPNEQKIGDYYASCMDTARIDREGLKRAAAGA